MRVVLSQNTQHYSLILIRALDVKPQIRAGAYFFIKNFDFLFFLTSTITVGCVFSIYQCNFLNYIFTTNIQCLRVMDPKWEHEMQAVFTERRQSGGWESGRHVGLYAGLSPFRDFHPDWVKS